MLYDLYSIDCVKCEPSFRRKKTTHSIYSSLHMSNFGSVVRFYLLPLFVKHTVWYHGSVVCYGNQKVHSAYKVLKHLCLAFVSCKQGACSLLVFFPNAFVVLWAGLGSFDAHQKWRKNSTSTKRTALMLILWAHQFDPARKFCSSTRCKALFRPT